jgi:hypothetical protein
MSTRVGTLELKFNNYTTTTDLATNYAKKTDIPSLTPYALTADLTTNYAKKSELAPYALTTTLNNYALKTDLPSLTPYALKTDLANLATTMYVDAATTNLTNKFADYTKTTDLVANYAKKTDIPVLTNYALKTDIPTLTNYALKTDIPTLTNYALKTDIPTLTNYALKTDLTPYAKTTDLTGYAKSTDVTTLATKFNTTYGLIDIPSTSTPLFKVDNTNNKLNIRLAAQFCIGNTCITESDLQNFLANPLDGYSPKITITGGTNYVTYKIRIGELMYRVYLFLAGATLTMTSDTLFKGKLFMIAGGYGGKAQSSTLIAYGGSGGDGSNAIVDDIEISPTKTYTIAVGAKGLGGGVSGLTTFSEKTSTTLGLTKTVSNIGYTVSSGISFTTNGVLFGRSTGGQGALTSGSAAVDGTDPQIYGTFGFADTVTTNRYQIKKSVVIPDGLLPFDSFGGGGGGAGGAYFGSPATDVGGAAANQTAVTGANADLTTTFMGISIPRYPGAGGGGGKGASVGGNGADGLLALWFLTK